MKVSVIIPVFNEQKYIEPCLKSLIAQKVKPYEIIIVDNNCTDKTIQLAQKYNVKIVIEKKQGQAHARNCGFNSAEGDILARCDADSVLPPNWIERITYNFKKYKIDALTGPTDFYDMPIPGYVPVFLAYLDIFNLIRNHHTLRGPNMAISKSIWEKVKNLVCVNDKKMHEDMDLAIHIYENEGIIRLDKKLLVGVSGRRAKKDPHSFFIEYPMRVVKMLQDHKTE